ncbi:MAG: alcohol dehydrogenase catalytic domain-containing protein [Anaerolineaceae bacterium]|nr:alcohol dehydrogenase catalytic domain-containing protein [Anaerolineaceae bacterium]
MPLMRAVQVAAPGAEFELVQKEIPQPKENEVLIKVEACGICHGDAVVKEGRFPGITYPRVPGHEVVGKIDKLGSKVTGWQIGQRVGVGWYGGPCLTCESCKRGDLANCENFLTTGIHIDGGYAEYMAAPMQGLAAIPDELTAVEAAPLLCAGRTTFTALRYSGALAGDLVAVHGLGGLGHLGLQFARKFGFRTVAISRGTQKEALAYQLGAHYYIDADSTDAAAELKKMGGARLILATAPNSKAISALINGLCPDGQVLIVAWQNEPMQISPWQLLGGRRSVKGWTARPARTSSEDTLQFSVTAGVLPMVEVFPLEQAALAYEKMASSKVHFRSVLTMDGQA